jgi:hypothetical protein
LTVFLTVFAVARFKTARIFLKRKAHLMGFWVSHIFSESSCFELGNVDTPEIEFFASCKLVQRQNTTVFEVNVECINWSYQYSCSFSPVRLLILLGSAPGLTSHIQHRNTWRLVFGNSRYQNRADVHAHEVCDFKYITWNTAP